MARWLTSSDHPLLPRVLVNRVWLHHFGRGLVGTPSDFGLQGERPTHPELLDWLAAIFISPSDSSATTPGLGWSLKRLHRLIMTSTAYRQSSLRHAEGQAADPDNRLYWHKPIQRLEAEAIRDSILAVSGTLELKMHGPPVPVREDVTGQVVVGIDKKEGDNKMPVDVPMGAEEFRRSVYVQVRRSKPLAFLNVFDAPVMEVNCERRNTSTVAPQSLMLMNSGFILQQASRFAARLQSEAGQDPSDQVRHAWHLAFARAPSDLELARSLAFLELQRGVTPNPSEESKDAPDPSSQALTSFCQTLLSANEFLYVD